MFRVLSGSGPGNFRSHQKKLNHYLFDFSFSFRIQFIHTYERNFRTMKKYSVLIAGLLAATVSFGATLQVVDTVEEALAKAREKKGFVMLNFTGTDWCTACKHLKEKVLNTDTFCNAYGDKVVMTTVDFPRLPELRAKVSKEEAARREKLLTSYQLRGLPAVVLLDPGGFPFAILNGARPTPEEYIPLIEEGLKAMATRDAAFEKAQTLTGMERAKVLAEALNAVPKACRDKYPRIVTEINLLDPNNTLGYRNMLGKSEAYIKQMQALQALGDTFVGHFKPEQISADIQKIKDYLNNPELDPEIRQLALRGLGDSYALLFSVLRGDDKKADREAALDQMLKAYQDAVAVDPDTATAKKLQTTIDINLQRIEAQKKQKQQNAQP